MDKPYIRLCGEEIREPGHICAFFDSREEKYGTLAPYFKDSIGRGDCLINIVDADVLDTHLMALAAERVPVQHALRTDRLRVMTSEDTYIRNGELDLEGVLEMLRVALETAKGEGRCVRTCGEMNWIARTPSAGARAMEYEARVNQFVPTFDCTLLCVYDVATTPAAMVSDILATHPFAVVKGRLRANPYFVQPDEYLEMLRARSA